MNNKNARDILLQVARQAMEDRGLSVDFSARAVEETKQLDGPSPTESGDKDLRNLPWCSIDNDDSLDLDQLTVAEAMPNSVTRVLVAISDVTGLVKRHTAIDEHAGHNTTSVYTAVKVFPMLPEKLSTDLTSLNYHADRRAIIADILFGSEGDIQSSSIYPAVVRNHAKLAYNGVTAWLEGRDAAPPAIQQVDGLADNLRLQDAIAQKLKARRHEHGALDLQTLEVKAVLTGDEVTGLRLDEMNRARTIIEDLMIATNDVVARFLQAKGVLSLRRVVRTPARWNRIVEVAAGYGFKLPAVPDAVALEHFLVERRQVDPLHFPDLSLTVIKLIGLGEYVVERPGEPAAGHFSLAVRDYTHSTAPNRRFSDLVTQRILKAVLGRSPEPYKSNELTSLAADCTAKEDDARKVERHVIKSTAAMLLSPRIGEQFDAVCTGAAEKGTWVRIFDPPVEGKLASGYEGVDVGDRLRVQLVSTDVAKGFIDFKRVVYTTNPRPKTRE